jgi:predicted NBD/HSP70 family sugar kinase
MVTTSEAPSRPADHYGLKLGAGGILGLIREGAASTRSELVELSGLPRSTIAQHVDALLERQLLVGAAKRSSTGGRPPTLLEFNGDAGVVLAADLGATHSRLAVTNLAGVALAESETEIEIADGPDPILTRVEQEFEDLLRDANRSGSEVRAVGVGVPGPVELATGVAISPPIMPGWDGYPLAERLRARFGTRVLVDNDVNVMALGEHFSHWRDTDQLIFVKVGTGIGMGIMLRTGIHHGAQGSAGDLGHVHLDGHDDTVCKCGNRGCLEAVAGGGALAKQLTSLGTAAANAREVAKHVRAGNADAIRLVREAGRELGTVLATVVNLINPAVVVIGGDLAAADEQLLAGVRELIYRRSPPLATHKLRIGRSSAGDRAGVVGASVMAIESVLAPAAIEHDLAVNQT